MNKSNKKSLNLILIREGNYQLTLTQQKAIKFVKNSQVFKFFKFLKLSNLSKKLLALVTIILLSMTAGACTSKKPDNQNPTPAPAPAPKIQLDVSGIDKDKAFFVTPTGTNGKDCTTWENACDLQTAIDNANTDANKKFVLVSEGIYFTDPEKNDEAITFKLEDGVKIYGGFDVSAEELKRYAQASILEGKLSDTLNTKLILKGENLTDTTILDGFLIQNALNEDTSNDARGAGLYLNKSNPKLTNLVFKNNELTNSIYGGGAIYNLKSEPSISNSTFISNSVKTEGGAIYNFNSHPNISNSTFINNNSNDGGAIYNTFSSKPNITNCKFIKNTSKFGGAIDNTNATPNISNSIFIENSVTGSSTGSAINNYKSDSNISNSVFIGNYDSNNSGGAISNKNSSPNISNSILWNNKKTSSEYIVNIHNGDADSKPVIKNSILNANSITGNNLNLDASNKTPATFVIESDGKITDTASQELIKDKGDNDSYKTTTGKEAGSDKDLAGNPRLKNNIIDIGAYELQD